MNDADRKRAERAVEDAWAFLEDGDAGAAARALESAQAAAPADPAVIEVEAEIALADENPDDALDAFERWMEADPADPTPLVRAAEIYLDFADDTKSAIRLLRDALSNYDMAADEEADARDLLSEALQIKGDQAGQIRENLAVMRLDEAMHPRRPVLTEEEFERIARSALDELPRELLDQLGNVPVVVHERPSREMVLDGTDPRILGLFTGIPLPHGSTLGRPASGVILLFRRNIERFAGRPEDIPEQIRVTVIHETAHYFGLDEDDLRRLGLG
jgi:predicted Zn-dependent protease with MMP-like domain